MGLSDKLKALVQTGINAWTGENGSAADMKAEVLKQEVQAANIINKEMVEKQAEQVLMEDLDSAIQFQQQAEQVHRENIQFIRNSSQVIRNEQLKTNAEELVRKQKEEVANALRLRQLQREEELNKVKVAEGFNFYKVRDNLDSGLTLKDALDAAGCIENNQYKLDYGGRGFIRLPDEEIDNVCLNVRQNMILIEYLKGNNAVVLLTGFPHQFIYSIGILIYDRDFGFLLIKHDRDYDSYPTGIVYKMEKNNLFEGRTYDEVALCKTYIKIAGKGAICYNINHGLEMKEDYKLFKEMANMNPIAAEKVNYLLQSLGLRGIR